MSGFLSRAFEKRSISLTNPPEWFLQMIGEGTYTGEQFSIEGSLKVTAVLAGFTILMEDISSLPLILYRRLERGKERANRHPYYSLLHDNFNPEHTSLIFREIMIGHLLGWGNFYGQLIWDGRGVVREIWPLSPARMQVFRENGERRYLYTELNGNRIAFRQEEILHVPAFGFDGLVGYSRIGLARNAIGLSIAAEKYGSKMFANDARPSVLFKTTKTMDKDTKQELRESWNQLYAGAGKAAQAAVIDQGLDFETIGFPPEDAQFLQTRQFQVSEIARIFRIPPHMLADVDRSTSWGSGIEQQEQGYVNHTLRPWSVRIEQQLHKDLLLGRERRSYIIEHLYEALLRGDIQARSEAYTKAITNGWLSRNEVREKENMNPYDGGDEFLVPLNLVGEDNLNEEPAQVNEPLRNLQPILLEAAQRALKREAYEVRDAAHRWLDKGKPEKFSSWLEEFYKSDQPAYLRTTFAPYVQAGLMDYAHLTHVTALHSEAQGLRLASALEEQADLQEITEGWPERAAVLTAALMESNDD